MLWLKSKYWDSRCLSVWTKDMRLLLFSLDAYTLHKTSSPAKNMYFNILKSEQSFWHDLVPENWWAVCWRHCTITSRCQLSILVMRQSHAEWWRASSSLSVRCWIHRVQPRRTPVKKTAVDLMQGQGLVWNLRQTDLASSWPTNPQLGEISTPVYCTVAFFQHVLVQLF